MNGDDAPSRNVSEGGGPDGELARALESYLSAVEAGRPVDPDRLAAEHPAIAAELRSCLEVLRLAGRVEEQSVSEAAVGPVDGGPPTSMLGDFRIIRQVGRGGMGVVYEAEQVSLHRRVALKVLPFASALDPLQLRRFQTEALAAAQLHHTNIVPVFSVGCERGVHYYTMQYIEGQTVAALVRDLRRLAGLEPPAGEASTAGPALAEEVASGRLAPDLPDDGAHRPLRPAEEKVLEGRMRGRPPSNPSHSPDTTRTRGYFRTVAHLGIQAAEALEHAHALGIVHRDIKPANLLVDPRGNLWVTDFGLARMQADRGLTMTGDVIGTLRYMSPEQAQAKRAIVDQRSDIYSLGATLYELLALRPAIAGEVREELLLQIALEEPRPPRRFNPSIPIDLETIVLKAMAKEPAERYATARELADDLRRFLEVKPIQARRPSLWDRALKLGRRHAGLVAAALLVLLLAVGGLAMSLILIGRERDLASAKEQEATASEQRARQRAVDLERQLYINRINRAYAEWRDDNVALAEALLDECPPALGGWEWSYCRRLCHLERSTLVGRGRPIGGLAFGPAGRWLITTGLASLDGDRSMPGDWTTWDLATGRPIASRPAPGDACIAVAPAGTMVAGGSKAGPILLWEASPDRPPRLDREPIRILRGRNLVAEALAFSPDGLRLAAAGKAADRGVVELWVVETGRCLRVLDVGPDAALDVTFRPDGGRLAAACHDGDVRLWDAATGAAAGVLRGHLGEAFAAAYSPDGRRIATGGRDETVRVWDAATGGAIHVLRGHGSFVRAVAWSADGTRVASASEDRTVRIWDATIGKEIGRLRGHSGFVTGVAFSPDGRGLASASEDQTVKLWDPSAVEPAATAAHKGWVPRVAFFPDGSKVATACWDNAIRILDAATGREVRALGGAWEVIATPQGDQVELAHSLAISPDGRRLAATNRSGTVRIWDAADGQLLLTLRGHGDRSLGVSFHPDGRSLAAAGWDGTVRIWDADSGGPIRVFRGSRGAAITAVYSPDGSRIASAFTDGTVRIWDPSDGRELMRLDCDSSQDSSTLSAEMVAFSPDGRRLAACSNPPAEFRSPGEVRVFDLATGRRVFTLRRHTSEVHSVAFSPDGRRLVSGGFDQTVKLWETETGQEVLTLRGHTAAVLSVAFSPDGRRLATGSVDRTARIWDAGPK